jgi:hypothetical protein
MKIGFRKLFIKNPQPKDCAMNATTERRLKASPGKVSERKLGGMWVFGMNEMR